MASDRTVPILPCADIDEIIAFYEALGFQKTYRQVKPNPHTVMERGDIGLHFSSFDGFVPANSYGSCLVVTDDADALYAAFSSGIKSAFGRLPVEGIPRFTRPRKKLNVVHGFSVVDPGGNWIRVVQRKAPGAVADDEEEAVSGLAKAVLTAARLGDAKGDVPLAVATLERALAKAGPDAPATDRIAAYVYRAELALAQSDPAAARHALAEVRRVSLDPDDQDAAAADLRRAAELEAELA